MVDHYDADCVAVPTAISGRGGCSRGTHLKADNRGLDTAGCKVGTSVQLVKRERPAVSSAHRFSRWRAARAYLYLRHVRLL